MQKAVPAMIMDLQASGSINNAFFMHDRLKNLMHA